MFDSNIFNQVLEQWRKEGVKLLPPHNEAEVIEGFEKMNRKCSADVIALYCATGGMDDYDMNSECFTFWSLKKVIEENKDQKHREIAFADFLIDSHRYYFKCEDVNRSSVYTDWSEDGKLIKIADYVNEFFEMYIHKSEKLGLF